MPLKGIPLKGAHNVENVLAAVVRPVWPAYWGDNSPRRREVPGRRAPIGIRATINGVEYYNDSKATNVDATAKAIAAFSSGIHLILGARTKTPTTGCFRTAAGPSECGLHHRFGGS